MNHLPRHEAILYQQEEEDRVRCQLCAHRCLVRPGKRGICGVRENTAGTLSTLVYGYTIAQHVDPVEKKPLFHFYPGSTAYSIATPGCNFRCAWCQNADISQLAPEAGLPVGQRASPRSIVTAARRRDCRSIAYTYTEPTIFYEYAYDTAVLAHQAGLANVFVTNGYMTPEMLDLFHPYLDAANVDLKSFRDETYRQYAGARLQPVLDSLERMKQLGVWIEVTTLVVPTVNDDPAELREIARFIVHLGTDVPWHLGRFSPTYQMREVPSTPVATLRNARGIGLQEGLRYVYLGNVAGERVGDTFCPVCERTLIRRGDLVLTANDIRDGRCPDCGAEIAGVGMDRR